MGLDTEQEATQPIHPLVEIIHNISEALEAQHIDAAREMCAEVLDASPKIVTVPALVNFEAAFRTACRKNDVQEACYVLFRLGVNGAGLNVKTGGNMRVASIVSDLIKDGVRLRQHLQAHGQAQQQPPSKIIVPGGT